MAVMTEKISKFLEGIDHSRREAIRKLLMGTAFMAPVAMTFGLGGSANAESPACANGAQGGVIPAPFLPPLISNVTVRRTVPDHPVPADGVLGCTFIKQVP
jgi:hypothetical protein